MVDIFVSDRLQLVYPAFKNFIEQELYPEESKLLSLPFYEAAKTLDVKREKAKVLGLWAPYLTEKAGSMGLSMLEFAQVSELMATTPFGHYVFNCQAPDIGNIELL
jgi:alkylation response protein AidB-like acyl-CoA dehydrogenase